MLLRRILRPSALSTPLLRPAIVAPTSRILPALANQRFLTTETAPAAATPAPTTPSSASAPIAPADLSLLPLLRAQPDHYATIHIQGFPFLVTVGDKVTLPFRLKGVALGDVLKITHVSVLGSRDYTLKGTPWVDERLFEVKATVVEETAEPMRIKEKKKQRTRRTRTVRSKHVYTVLRVAKIEVQDVEA